MQQRNEIQQRQEMQQRQENGKQTQQVQLVEMQEKHIEKQERKQIDAIKFMFPELQKVSDEEIKKAVYLAKYYGLDPLKREVYFVPFRIRLPDGTERQTVQLVVSYLEYIKRAEKTGDLNGWQVTVNGEGDDAVATVTIYRKSWEYPFVWTVHCKEVKKETRSWKEMPLFMLRKVAIAQAFRICFPEHLGSLPYEEAEVTEVKEIKDI